MRPAEYITKVEEILADPKNWVKGNWATNGRNQIVPAASKKAKKFDLAGAFIHVAPPLSDKEETEQWFIARQAFRIVLMAEYGDGEEIISFNDHKATTHDEVLKLLRETRERLS